MRAIVQRVKNAKVKVNNSICGEIGTGLVALLGIAGPDTSRDAEFLLEKIVQLRIFCDDAGKMNRSLLDVAGGLMIVPNFTVYADTSKGRRPAFDRAAPPEVAQPLYDYFVERSRTYPIVVASGIFQADMLVEIHNDGPITIICDSSSTLRILAHFLHKSTLE